MDKISFLAGSFSGEATFAIGAQKVKAPTTAKGSLTMGGKFYEINVKYEIPGMPTEGKAMISYDPAKKTYNGWWFDGSNPGTIKQSADLKGDKLVLLTKNEDSPGGILVRTTWKKSEKGVHCTVEMKPGDSWTTMVDLELTKRSER